MRPTGEIFGRLTLRASSVSNGGSIAIAIMIISRVPINTDLSTGIYIFPYHGEFFGAWISKAFTILTERQNAICSIAASCAKFENAKNSHVCGLPIHAVHWEQVWEPKLSVEDF
jgi:hypothetical protein